MSTNNIKAWLYGIADGWNQPYGMSTSRNVDHLDDGYGTAAEAHDRGANLGQLIRAGHRSEAFENRYFRVF